MADITAFGCGRNSHCFNYMKVTVDDKNLSMETFDIDGNKIDGIAFTNFHR